MQCKSSYFLEFLLKNFQFSVFQEILQLHWLLIMGPYIWEVQQLLKQWEDERERRGLRCEKSCYPIDKSQTTPPATDWLWMQSDNTLQWNVGKNYRWGGVIGNRDPIIIGSKGTVTDKGFRNGFLIQRLVRPLLGQCHHRHRTLGSGYGWQTGNPAINAKTSEYQTSIEWRKCGLRNLFYFRMYWEWRVGYSLGGKISEPNWERQRLWNESRAEKTRCQMYQCSL